MSVKGKVSEHKDFTKKVGLFEGKIIAFNPSLEELDEILGSNSERKEPEYLKETQDGDKIVNLTIWVEDVKSGMKAPVRIGIVDKPLTNKTGDKTIFINVQGNTSYFIDKEENLPDWFKGFNHWQAKQGEDKLYNFLRAWLQIDTYNDKSAEMFVDIKKILRGNVKELRDLMKTEFNNTVLFNSIITSRTTEDKDGNEVTKEYQNLYNKDFLPGSTIKFFKLGGKYPKFVQKYVDDCNGAYGIKDYYILKPLEDYDPLKNEVSGDGALVEDAEDSPSY